MSTTTPLTLISGALRSIGGATSGDPIPIAEANDAFIMLNDMLDQWSNEKLMVFCVQEAIHELTGSKYIYTIGPGGNVGASFTGSIAGNVLTVTVLGSGALSVGQVLTTVGANPIIAGTAITSLGTAIGGTGVGALGTYYVNQSQTVGSETITSTHPRPLRINSAFVRVVNSISGTLDYPVAVIHMEQYELIGIKTLPGPWPRAVYYQPSEPVGVLNYWPNPSQGEMHLFCDTILNQFQTLNDTVTLPQGFNMAIRMNLAALLMPEYGKADPNQVELVHQMARAGKSVIKRTNMQPPQTMQLDPMLVQHRAKDASFILHGGFN